MSKGQQKTSRAHIHKLTSQAPVWEIAELFFPSINTQKSRSPTMELRLEKYSINHNKVNNGADGSRTRVRFEY